MGHEFVELKNSHAAIEAYRKAIGQSPFPYNKLPVAVEHQR